MILAAGVLAGCGPGRPTLAAPAEPAPAPLAPSSTAVDAGAGPADAMPPVPAPRPVTADECGLLVDKMIAIGLAEQHARDPRAPQATAGQQAAIRARLLAQALPSCATLPRASWDCAMAAGDRAAMSACEGAAGAGAP